MIIKRNFCHFIVHFVFFTTHLTLLDNSITTSAVQPLSYFRGNSYQYLINPSTIMQNRLTHP